MEVSSEENFSQPHHNFQHQMFDKDQTLDKADGFEAPVEPPGSNRTVPEMSKGMCGEQRSTLKYFNRNYSSYFGGRIKRLYFLCTE